MSDGLHEFQTATICEDRSEDNKKIIEWIDQVREKNYERSIKIPTLPEQIDLAEVKQKLNNKRIPVGIDKVQIKTKVLNFKTSFARLVLASRLKYAKYFVSSLIDEIKSIDQYLVCIDPTELSIDKKDKVDLYVNSEFDQCKDKVLEIANKIEEENSDKRIFIILNSYSKFRDKLEDPYAAETIFTDLKGKDCVSIILVEEPKKLSEFTYDTWFSSIDVGEGVFLGVGVDEQSILKISSYSREFSQRIPINYGYFISEGSAEAIKLVETEKAVDVEDDEE